MVAELIWTDVRLKVKYKYLTPKLWRRRNIPVRIAVEWKGNRLKVGGRISLKTLAEKRRGTTWGWKGGYYGGDTMLFLRLRRLSCV